MVPDVDCVLGNVPLGVVELFVDIAPYVVGIVVLPSDVSDVGAKGRE